jgi:hypothetical protein
MKNYTSTIDIPNACIEFNVDESSELTWSQQHSIHYDKYVRPIHNDIRDKVNQIKREQTVDDCQGRVHILWNKCRYFELSFYNKEIRNFVSQSAKVKVSYGNMLVGGRLKLEAVVKAFNKKGIYCDIQQDWI